MRLWHQFLIRYLPGRRLLGQHRECCALRGRGWGRRHSVVDYVFRHPYCGYDVDDGWLDGAYRGKALGMSADRDFYCDGASWLDEGSEARGYVIYPEHDDAYLLSCLNNLAGKGAELENGQSVSKMILELVSKGVT